ncbi:MAG: hypothetical protein Q9222_001366 [Ikaeria aurantiellina]
MPFRLAKTPQRLVTTTSRRSSSTNLSSRWLSDIKTRIGKCIIFGLQTAQVTEAGSILRTLTKDWRRLLAGSEGFLVGKSRAGLEGHRIVWGEMDSMRAAARCVEDIVVYDYRHGHKTSLKPFMFDQFNDTWRAQEEAKARSGDEIQGLFERVRRLEVDSWDREGAVEDMGAT